MRRINELADRLLARVVPRIDAAAACQPKSYWGYCYCNSLGQYYCRPCQLLASCDDRCGSSYQHVGGCANT